jgi:DNA-binding transcriptional LysR family regulator
MYSSEGRRVNLKRLETFVSVVRAGSFAAAAAQMNTAQSTVSMRIQELEQDLGVILFDRGQRKAHLSAKGRELLPLAESAVTLCTEIRRTVGAAEALSGIVRMGVAELVAVTWLPELVSAIHASYPNLTLELDVSLTAELADKLDAGDLDLALVPGERFDSGLVAHDLGRVRFAWMAGPGLRLPHGVLTPRDLRQVPMLSLGERSYHYARTEEWLDAEGGRRRRPDICNSMSILASLTAAGLGVSLLPPMCYAADIASGRLRVLETAPDMPEVVFAAIYPKQHGGGVATLIASIAGRVSTFRQGGRDAQPSGAGAGALVLR